jgi:DNA-binding CsgD family transcriptional regulator
VFHLTPAEAKLAIAISRGKTLDEVAQDGGTSVATVRKQLGTVFAKTNTHRQAELVTLVARLSILP